MSLIDEKGLGLMREVIEVCLNNEWMKLTKFKSGDRVANNYDDIGTVIDTEDGGLFVNVDWEENKPMRLGKTWMANNLRLVD